MRSKNERNPRRTSIVIQVPASAVYAYLLAFTRHPEWVKNLQRVRQESAGPIQVGTTFATQEGPPSVALRQRLPMIFHFLIGVLGGAKTYSRAEIIGLEPDRRIDWQAGVPKGDGFFNLAQWEMLLEPQGQSTRLTQQFIYQPQTRAFRRMMRWCGISNVRGDA